MVSYKIKYSIHDDLGDDTHVFEVHVKGYNLLDAQVRLIRKLQSLGMPLFILKIENKIAIEYITKYKKIMSLMNQTEEVA